MAAQYDFQLTTDVAELVETNLRRIDSQHKRQKDRIRSKMIQLRTILETMDRDKEVFSMLAIVDDILYS